MAGANANEIDIQQLLSDYNALMGNQGDYGQQEGQGQQEVQGQQEDHGQQVDQAQPTTSEMGQGQYEAQRGFAITATAMAFWDYANAILLERGQNHPYAQPPQLPVQMPRREKCILTLMVEEKRDVLRDLWDQLDEIERILGLEDV
ncbi:hypothetical protein DEU56DRAFT_760045 [Suillus clintonianus]|uniref:uncharacterized protein n=1 Tax=Suillus clintonianus TaxID=1904413 RepID=UPI001B873CEA|nr:uncharacterized protein DEU56DRAFT_760045 [Suillus clintonianus]KAG2123490.1 hypothetical protein DEU56DRAFT_760045 [Suillus clintonianus]